MNHYLVVRDNEVIKVYHTLGELSDIEKTLEIQKIPKDEAYILKKLDDFQYAKGDKIYPYNPKDKRPETEVIINPVVQDVIGTI